MGGVLLVKWGWINPPPDNGSTESSVHTCPKCQSWNYYWTHLTGGSTCKNIYPLYYNLDCSSPRWKLPRLILPWDRQANWAWYPLWLSYANILRGRKLFANGNASIDWQVGVFICRIFLFLVCADRQSCLFLQGQLIHQLLKSACLIPNADSFLPCLTTHRYKTLVIR